ncbi:MAG: hypothetical protein IT559_05445 [Alphaproteobacteria bacterium]|nr:hypothetical protein [Alphaproteobacteria bacterium]
MKKHEPSLNLQFNFYAPNLSWEDMIDKKRSNCFAYSLNLPQSGWAIPGKLQQKYTRIAFGPKITKEHISNNLTEDGLEEISATEALSGKFHAIACLLKPYTPHASFKSADFHFLRLDHKTGTWSHKPGPASPANTDENDQIITNPEKAHFFFYDQFCGFFAIPDEGISYMPQC